MRQAIGSRRYPLTVMVFAAMMAVVWLTATPFSWDNDEAAHYWTARDIYEAGELPGPGAFPVFRDGELIGAVGASSSGPNSGPTADEDVTRGALEATGFSMSR